MKLLLSLFILIFFTNNFTSKNEEIPVIIHFNYSKDVQFEKGIISIKETNQSFEITTLEDFIIPLKKGKYTLVFSAENFGNISISKKLNEKNKVFNILIQENKYIEIHNQFSEEQIINQLENGTANFINFGLGMQDFSNFKKKYGVGFINQGCVISGSMGSEAIKINQYIAKYLDQKHSESWRNDLPFLPFGLK